jgi:hypothetical protein
MAIECQRFDSASRQTFHCSSDVVRRSAKEQGCDISWSVAGLGERPGVAVEALELELTRRVNMSRVACRAPHGVSPNVEVNMFLQQMFFQQLR